MKNIFHNFSIKISKVAGSLLAFSLAILIVIVWLLLGPNYHFSNSWMLTMGTITDVVIFLMVFSIQNTQIRDSKAIQLKLDELIISTKKARDAFVGLETLTDDELEDIDKEFKKLIDSLAPTPAMVKLHKKIAEEKNHRFNFPQKAGHLVNSLLGTIGTSVNDSKKN